LAERRAAVERIRFFIKGFITRNQPLNDCNAAFIQCVKQHWLVRLSKKLPKTFMNHTWPAPAAHCHEASTMLKKMHLLHLARIYRAQLAPEKKRQFELKVVAEAVFKDKKKNYASSLPHWFIEERLTDVHKTNVNSFTRSPQFGEKVMVGVCLSYQQQTNKR